MAKIATPEDLLYFTAMNFVHQLPESDKSKILTTFHQFSDKKYDHKLQQIIAAMKTVNSQLYYEFKKYNKNNTLLSS